MVELRKVFADANVLIAGAASRTGASSAVLLMAEIGPGSGRWFLD